MNKKKLLTISIILTVVSIVFTILVKYFDTAEIGPGGMSSVGFAHLNEDVRDFFGRNETFDTISDIFLGLSFMTIPVFAFLGIKELIKTKSLKKVDKSLYILAGFYVLVALVFVVFELLEINVRPIFIDGAVEPSYPSSHTLFAICLAFSAVKEASFFLTNKKALTGIKISAWIIVVATILTRLFSGVHWATDIIGGILIGVTLVFYFYTALAYLYKAPQENYHLPKV